MTVPEPKRVAIADVAIATLTVPGYVDFLAADGRGVWATNEGRVERFTADRPEAVATVSIPSPCGAMIVAGDSLWVASCADMAIHRIDLGTGEQRAVIPTGLADPTGELSLAAGGGSVWVLSAEGVLSRVDIVSNEVVARIAVQPGSYCAAFDFGAVWVTNSGSPGHAAGSVQRIDPLSNAVVATIPAGPQPRFLAAGEGGVWTLNWGDGSVTRIDPETDQVAARLPLGMLGGGGDIATGAGRVWVRGNEVLLAVVDPTDNAVETIFGPPAGSGAVRVAKDLVWVTAHDAKTMWVLRAAQDRL